MVVCDRCIAIDRELLTFKRLRESVEDKLVLVLIAVAVEALQSERVALHPDANKRDE